MISTRVLTTAIVLGAAAAATPAHGQALPPASVFVPNLDLECYRTSGPALNTNVMLTHLNPVLVTMGLPAHNVTVRELVQTCVPVRKGNNIPPAGALAFISQVDFACYRVEADPRNQTIHLAHLNPVLANLPLHDVQITQPAQLCLPVAKNNKPPTDNVLALARFLDLECWDTIPQMHPSFTVGLTQLNPQLTGIAPHPMTLVTQPRQLCVPVRKNTQMPPQALVDIIKWVDLEKFAAQPVVTINPPVNVTLTHLNPLFANVPPIQVVLQFAVGLMVPVAKNGNHPNP
jgi:hypothetical protein